MVIPTQDVIPNNSDNVRTPQHAMMQIQVKSQIIRNYSTMPKFDGVSVDRENVFIGAIDLPPGLQLMILEA